jgi:hypothetical protein
MATAQRTEKQTTIGNALFSGEVHPVAAMFPMMSDEELDDLAEDIKANGLLHPVILDAEGMLIDGRNRIEACRRAEMDPTFGLLNGHEPVAFILSQNVARRHLTQGQKCIGIARMLKITPKVIFANKAAALYGVSENHLTRASVVLKYADELADDVMEGTSSLTDAYEEAKRRKEAAESDESRFAVLQRDAPDLAVMVQEERLTLKGALAELATRRKEEAKKKREWQENIRQTSANLLDALTLLDPHNMDPQKSAVHLMHADERFLGLPQDFSAERARRCADVLLRYADLWEKEDHGKQAKD